MKHKKWITAAVIIVGGVIGGYFYGRHATMYPSTSDAYVHASVVTIATQISGRISVLPVKDHQHVEKGQMLIQIDPQPFHIALDRAEANLEMARQQSRAAGEAVVAAHAAVAERRANLKEAADNAKRVLELYRKHTIPKAEVDDAVARRDDARAALIQAKANLQKAIQQQVAAGAKASIQVAQATLEQARLDLSYTRITAPASGILGSINVRVGDVVNQAQALFPLVEDKSFWVDANFKETDLVRIRRGQPATISVDMAPGETFHSVVDSVSPASGTAFSLLPPENATGNWVKVRQRFAVKIPLTEESPDPPLRIGASAEVTVDTTSLAHD
jgi:membrane fusion protein (multidrug efflux system)